MNDMHDFRRKMILLAGLLVLAGILSLLSTISISIPGNLQNPFKPTLGEAIRHGIAAPPPLSTSTRDKLEKSHGFQYLISYTDQGFEPSKITLKTGETVRFTNNSSHALWIAASGTLYPGVQNGCGSSALDSCAPISPQDFWEFTFTEAGMWKFVNNLSKTDGGEVVVKVR